ncbi:MAG: FAD-dependent oxidoreductase [bacterium]
MARKIRCLVDRVTDHGDRVYTLVLKPERPVPTFRPGQFLHLALDDYDPSGFWPESRVFSIASSPQERDRLVVCYSVKGAYTIRMERECVPGKQVWVKMPYGDFVVDGTRDVVLIAGGTGITAFQAFINGLKPDHSQRVRLLYGARRRELLLALELIEQKRRETVSLQANYFSETATEGTGPEILLGRVRLDVVNHCIDAAPTERRPPSNFKMEGAALSAPGVIDGCCFDVSTVYYLAGPPVMIAALREELVQRGVSVDNIRIDAWE